MMALPPRWSRLVRVPRPQRFLHFMSLRTGTEMICLTMLFNKVTGFYGLLAILTGVRLSTTQLLMYVYSCLTMLLLARLMPHIRRQTPFHCLALAWLYIADTVINTLFTAAFAITWFLAVSADSAHAALPKAAPGSEMIDDAAGFTSPVYNVTEVDVIVKPAHNPIKGQDAVAYAAAASATHVVAAGSPSLGHGVGIEESIPSLLVVLLLTLVRVYFILVMLSYARLVVRARIAAATADTSTGLVETGWEVDAEELFKRGTPQGADWRGKLGRVMLRAGGSYWAVGKRDVEWIRGMDGRFRAKQDRARSKERRERTLLRATSSPQVFGKV